MAHTSIQPADQDRYYAGDALTIPFEFTNEHDTTAIDLTGMTVEFRIKEDLTDDDANALVVKTGTEGGTEDEVSFPDPTNGRCEVHIATDDTSDVIMEDTVRVESAVVQWHVRVIDGSGNQVTSEVGDWEMWAS